MSSSATTLDQQVEALISGHKVVVFSKTRCGFCHKAKRALKSTGLALDDADKLAIIELDQKPVDEMAAMQQHLGKLTGATTVPRVFIGGAFVGGGNDVAELAKTGALAQLLRDAGIV
jgi:glutaredoxin 3